MEFNLYQRLASRTECDQTRSLARMANLRMTHTMNYEAAQLRQIRLNHSVLGLAGEAGELAAALEKWVYYGQDLDITNVAEEVGDCLWYLAELCNALGIDLGDCAAANVRKLKARYPEAFSDDKACDRDLRAEREAVQEAGYLKVTSAPHGPADWLCDCGHINVAADAGCGKCHYPRPWEGGEGAGKRKMSLEDQIRERRLRLSGQPADARAATNRPPDQPHPFGYDEAEHGCDTRPGGGPERGCD